MKKRQEDKVESEMNRCAHFTGIQHPECEAGINYHALMGDGVGCFAHMPCFNDDQSTVVCDKRRFPTREEAVAEVQRHDAAIAEFLNNLKQSICPVCKIQVKQRQSGPCVYGTCGHRLYQGTVMPAHAE